MRVESYGKRFLRNGMGRQIAKTIETKDAVVNSVFVNDSYANVQIQGSDKMIIAHFPQNWVETPSWLKPGNVIRINFCGGLRNRVEIIGDGYLRPSTATAVTPSAGPDDLLTSGILTPIPYNNRMAVMVKVGSYRISGTTYTLSPIGLGQYDPWYLGDGGALGSVAAVLNINSAPSYGNYRIDYIVAGIDGLVNYLVGTDFSVTPVYPTIPANHVLLGYIFLNSATTKITWSEINSNIEEAKVSQLVMEIDDDRLNYTAGPPEVIESSTTITIYLKDQYGADWPGTYKVGIYMFSGNGTLSGGDSSMGDASTSTIGTTIYKNTSPSSKAVFTYTRLGGASDQGPMLLAGMTVEPNLIAMGAIFVDPIPSS